VTVLELVSIGATRAPGRSSIPSTRTGSASVTTGPFWVVTMRCSCHERVTTSPNRITLTTERDALPASPIAIGNGQQWVTIPVSSPPNFLTAGASAHNESTFWGANIPEYAGVKGSDASSTVATPHHRTIFDATARQGLSGGLVHENLAPTFARKHQC